MLYSREFTLGIAAYLVEQGHELAEVFECDHWLDAVISIWEIAAFL